jgi:hypothetical protein
LRSPRPGKTARPYGKCRLKADHQPGWIVSDFSYDAGPDGRFLLVAREPIDEMVVNVTLNWFEELKRLVPTGQ